MTNYYIIFKIVSSIQGGYDRLPWVIKPGGYSYDEAAKYVKKFDSPRFQYKVLVEEKNKNIRGGEYYILKNENGNNLSLCYTTNGKYMPLRMLFSYKEASLLIENTYRLGANPQNQYLILKEVEIK